MRSPSLATTLGDGRRPIGTDSRSAAPVRRPRRGGELFNLDGEASAFGVFRIDRTSVFSIGSPFPIAGGDQFALTSYRIVPTMRDLARFAILR